MSRARAAFVGVSMVVAGLVVPFGAGVEADEPVSGPTVERAALVSSNSSRCLSVIGGFAGDVVVVNITNTGANGSGYGALRASGTTPVYARSSTEEFSSVNFAANTPVNPNLAVATVGSDGKFCYDGAGADHHVILDLVTIIPSVNIDAIDPSRILDSRGGARLRANSSRCVSVPGGSAGDVAVVNITNTAATGAGYGALRASGTTPVFGRTAAGQFSSVNFAANTPANPNLAVVTIGSDGKFCYDGAVADHHVILDLAAVIPAALVNAIAPTRILDSRGGARLRANSSRCVSVPDASYGDVAVVNITNTAATGTGYGALRASDTAPVFERPVAGQFSSVNFAANTPANPNLAMVKLGFGGELCYDAAGADHHVILDLAAVLPGRNINAVNPLRVLDTRSEADPRPATRDCKIPPNSHVDVTVETDLPMSSKYITLAVCGIHAAAALLPDGPSETLLVAYTDVDPLAQRFAELSGSPFEQVRGWLASGGAIAYSDSAIFFNVENFIKWGLQDGFIFNVGAHEWYHNYTAHHFYRGGQPEPMNKMLLKEPVWMLEATAHWYGTGLAPSFGFGAWTQFVRDDGAKYHAARFTGLEAWETNEGIGPYELLPYIGDLLVAESSRTAFLRTYWEARAVTTEPWQTTFADVFGIEVPEFYAKVAQLMKDIAP